MKHIFRKVKPYILAFAAVSLLGLFSIAGMYAPLPTTPVNVGEFIERIFERESGSGLLLPYYQEPAQIFEVDFREDLEVSKSAQVREDALAMKLRIQRVFATSA